MESRDNFSEYAELRIEYVNTLEDADLLDQRGLLRQEVVIGLGGAGYPQGGRVPEYCQERPADPICKVIDTESMTEEFLDIRGEYIDSLQERGLLDIQKTFTDAVAAGATLAGAGVGGAAIPAPGVDPDDLPPGIRPYVQPDRELFDGLPPQVGALF